MTSSLATVPDSVQHLQEEEIVTALSRHNLNVTEAARELDVPSADLRELLRAYPQYRAAAVEMMEHFVDLAEAGIYKGLKSGDPRMQFAASCFVIRYSGRSGARGWVTFGTAHLDPAPVEPKHYRVMWKKPDGTAYDALEAQATEPAVRDGKVIELPIYPKPQDAVVEDAGDGVAMSDLSDDEPGDGEPGDVNLTEGDGRHLGDPVSEARIPEAVPPIAPIPEPPSLPIWPHPTPPPPLLQGKFSWTPPARPQARRQPEPDLPLASYRGRLSRGGWR